MDSTVNPRTLPQDALPHPLQAFQATTANGMPYVYPGFGWEGSMCDRAIGTDSADALQFLHDHGIINHSTKDFFSRTLRTHCERYGAKKCAALLKKLGYPA